MNWRAWIYGSLLGGLTGGILRLTWPQMSELGAWGAALIILLLAVRIADILSN